MPVRRKLAVRVLRSARHPHPDRGHPQGGPQRVKAIWFNDPVLIQKGFTDYMPGHDDHLHVRYCTVTNPDINYRC